MIKQLFCFHNYAEKASLLLSKQYNSQEDWYYYNYVGFCRCNKCGKIKTKRSKIKSRFSPQREIL